MGEVIEARYDQKDPLIQRLEAEALLQWYITVANILYGRNGILKPRSPRPLNQATDAWGRRKAG